MPDSPGRPGAQEREQEGYDGHGRAPDGDSRPVGHQPAERTDLEPVAWLPVGAGIGHEPAERPRAPGTPATARRRPRRRRGQRGGPEDAGVEGRTGRRSRRGEPRAARSWPGHLRPAPAPFGSRHADVRGDARSRTVDAAMISPDEFDAFYKGARSRLLLQTYALTGDLPASRSAVRDSFVGAWHHWRKVSRLPDPETWVRPHAWSHALRRHTGRTVAPGQVPRPGVASNARGAGEAPPHPAQGAAADPADIGEHGRDRPRARRDRCPKPSGTSRRRPRSSPFTVTSRPRASGRSSTTCATRPSRPRGPDRPSSGARAPRAGVRTR